MKIIKNYKLIATAILFFSILSFPLQAWATSVPVNMGAKISFTFDDGLYSAYTQAAPTLAKYGMTGTVYVTSGCIGMITTPNTCRSDGSAVYMNWSQVTQIQNDYQWEVGSHTVSHPLLASSDASDGQPNKLTSTQVIQELTKSKTDLAAHGITATDFASPYGDYNQAVLSQIAKLYASHRGFADTGYNPSPYNDYVIRDQQVQSGVSVDTVKSYIDQAIANKQWLVLTFHDILPNASTNPDDYQYKTADLDAIAAYVKSKGVPVVNVSNGLINGPNLLTNSTFDNGLANGWTTDSTSVTKNTANNGNYPSSTNSIAIKSTTKNSHLFSPYVAVDVSSTYVLKSFLNLTKITRGALGYYIDEYNASGNWISGQYKLSNNIAWPQTVGFAYQPSSINVAKARLQLIIPANSGIQAYVDNFQWINDNSSVVTPAPTPTPTPIPTPVPSPSNLILNGTFDGGITGGWSTDSPTNIIADATNNGSPTNAANSVKMTASTKNIHLFAPKINLTVGKSYSLSTYVNIKQLTSGEVGFYIDEYDSNGNWISGKYATGVRAVGTTTISYSYTPTSANVASSSLQIILTGNSGILAYIDNTIWIQN